MAEPARVKAYRRGLWAETLAALYLRCKGYRILETRYKTPLGEIDLIARRGEAVVFVEVKARGTMGEALEAVHRRNRARVQRAALHYLAHHPNLADARLRFDVIALAPPFSLRHLDNAWPGHT